MARRDETVASFRNGITVIKSFANGHHRQTITDVAGLTGLSRATARRLLLTLCQTGLARTDGKYFQLTPAVLEIGQTFLAGMSELEIVRDVLLDFSHKTGSSASAAMLVAGDIIYVSRIPAPDRNVPIALGPGMRRPAHATAIGQVLLANLGIRELDKYFQTARLDPYTANTLTTVRAVKERLAQVRAQGYAMLSEEFALGLCSIAVAVPPTPGGTRLGIASSTPPSPGSGDYMQGTLLPSLRASAEMISKAAGTLAQ